MKVIGIVVAWAMCALLALILLLVPLARHADRRGQPGLLSNAVAKLRRLSLPALLALAAAFGGSVAYSGKTNGVQNLPPRPMLQLPAPTPPSIFDYPRTVTDSRAASGFALVGVGTNETFTFDPPACAEACADWRALGSFSRWTHVSPTNFAFPFGGTNATTFTFVPGGVAEFAGGADAPRVAPFEAKMGIAPERYWDSLGVTSRFWTATSPSNTFLATWQGALLGRRADRPVDVQLEFFPDGGFDYRYDLSRLASDGDLADARVGAWNAGGGETYSIPHRNLTSARWRPVVPEDALNPDRDNDGVTTVDELFFLGTDPGNPDSDFDGLSDGQELTLGLNPLDPYSNGGIYSDGFALKIGDLNPLANPPDSDYTYYEHVVYSGTTNGTVSIPESTAASAVLEVSTSGTGTGDLVVGMQALPLVGGAPTVYIPVPRGNRLAVRLRRRTGALSAFVGSADFAIGEMPGDMDGDPSGWICFPRTRPVPEIACIHDLCERKITVRIDPGPGAPGLSCLWWGSAAVAASNHADGVSATLTGNFDARHTARVWYELVHPQYLFGDSYLPQSVRFCPRPEDADDEPEDEPIDEPDPDTHGDNDDLYGDKNEETNPPCDCCDHCGRCSCHAGEAPSGVSDPVSPEPPDPEDPPSPDCPVHNCPYSECYELHGDAAPRTVTLPNSTHVLKIGRVPSVDAVALTVPGGAVNCCPCSDHRTNYVGLAYKSGHLAVKGADGLDFWMSETNCTVYVGGLTPTCAAAGAPLAFVTNGAISVRRNYATLGVDIDTPNETVETLNTLNPMFGIPATVCTNVSRAAGIDLVTRVRLAAGAVTLTAGGGAFQAWLDRSNTGQAPLLLVDGTTRPTVTMSLAKWRSLAHLTGEENEARTRVLLTSAAPGPRTLTYSFSAGGALNDSVMQNITFVNPPLLPDYNRDGAIDAQDVTNGVVGRVFRFWTNKDVWREDDAWGEYRDYDMAMGTSVTNCSDSVVNGRNDLVNLLPLAVRAGPFLSAWGNAATIKVRSVNGGVGRLRRCYSNASHDGALDFVKSDVQTAGSSPEPLRSAALGMLGQGGDVLSDVGVGGVSSGFVLLEASDGSFSDAVELVVEIGGQKVYAYTPPVSFCDVDGMYRWRNIRPDSACVDTFSPEGNDGPPGRPDGECDGTHLVFLHGYNVNEREARVWARAVFKRLWWAGMESMFTAVAWHGDDGQTTFAYHVFTPDYQRNVEHAFASASNLAATVNSLPGRKFMMAHSLGNMLVSAARQDHGLQYEKYFMVNAAVPVEAYDAVNGVTESSRAKLTPSAWVGYPQRLRAAGWHTLPPEGDVRRGLTWKGRFANVSGTVNYYSSEDEVLKCDDGANHHPYQREFAWYNQERYKGVKSLIQNVIDYGRNEGGWAFNPAYDVEVTETIPAPAGSPQPTQTITYYRHANAGEMTNVTDMALIATPFFGPFADNSICSTNGPVVVSAALRAQLLADAIPAESLPAGFSEVTDWNSSLKRNFNMSEFKDNINLIAKALRPWKHSFFLQVPYMVVHGLFENIINKVKE